jgi:hypothetical protein
MSIKTPTNPANEHNHVTRDIKPLGQCPACDRYHDRHIPRGEKNEKPKEPMTDIDQAFDEWLAQGGHNGEYNLRAAFEAGAKAHENLVKIHALEPTSDERCHIEGEK